MHASCPVLTGLAGSLGKSLGFLDIPLLAFEDFNLIGIVSDLDFGIIDDDGTLKADATTKIATIIS